MQKNVGYLYPRRAGLSAAYPGGVLPRLTRLLDDLIIGHADASYQKQLLHLSKKDLLIFDDWGLRS